MSEYTAAALAAILDPERKVPGWWQVFCPMCLKEMLPASKNVCEHCDIKAAVVFTGPPDLHTAREHNWRLEDWLEDDGLNIYRQSGETRINGYSKTLQARFPNVMGVPLCPAVCNKNHTAALVAAIERISNEQKR